LGSLRRDQSLSVRAEAEPRANNLLAWLAAMPASRLEVRTKGQPLLRDVRDVIRPGPDHVEGVAIRQLLGNSEILDMDEKVSVENGQCPEEALFDRSRAEA
jgi:hypothetical protein